MSGDVQPRKRKDKKRKKDDEDTVKEIPAPKVTAGAAQAATQPGDVQMHVHNDHGTGGHWCAKIIFFILLVGLGALIGLIVLENRDLSNADTPLSESRYAEYFEGWVDENREDDHHHEEILEALNQLDDHGEDDDDQAHADDDHDDEGLDEEEEDADDGAPYAEEEDHDDERDLEDDEDEGDLPKLDDDEVEEIVATEKKVAEQEAQAEADNDDDGDDDEDNADDNDDDSQADDDDDVDVDDDDKDDAAGPTTVDAQSDDDNGDDDDDTNGEDEPKVTQSGTGDDDDEDDQVVDDDDYNDDDQDNDNIGDQIDDDGDDEHENNVGEVEDDRNENYKQVNDDDGEFVDDGDEPVFGSKQTTEDDNDDDDDDEPENLVADDDDDNDADAIAKEIDQLADDDEGKTPFDEEKRTNALNEQINNLRADVEGEQKTEDSVDIRNETIHVKPNRLQESVTNGLPVEPVITAEVLKAQMDDLLDNYNKLADMMNFPKEKHSERETAKDDDDPLNDEPSYSTANVDNNDDDDDNEDDDFENFVDNDGGEEKYLAKLRREQEERNQQQQQKQQEKDESREQSSLVVQILVGAALIGAARIVLMPSSRGSTPQPHSTSQTAPLNSTFQQSQEQEPAADGFNARLLRSELATADLVGKAERIEELLKQNVAQPRSAVEGFISAGSANGPSDEMEYIEGNVILIEGEEGELYSGDEDEEYDYEQEEYGEELEEIEEEEEEEEEYDEQERKLEEQEREIGSFVPTTFEDFNSMYRAPPGAKTNESIPTTPDSFPAESSIASASAAPSGIFKHDSPKGVHKESPLMKKKPPKGALNKLIYGLHKEPLITAEDLQQPMDQEIPSRQSESQIYEEELNRAKRHLDELKDPKRALEGFEAILRKQRRLAPALFGKARALDALAERQQSNVLLGEAIEAYRDVILFGDSVDDETFKQAAERCIDRSRFRGQYLKVLDVHQELIRRFDSEPKYRNQLAVTYLLANRMAEAKAVLHETLMRWIDDGVALVHYGFVLKNHDKNMIEAVQYLREGIATGHEGTQDGRFYFHLGDALQRLGRQKEALEVYQEGAEKKLFLSLYQRSLYNVDNLKSRPFWSIEQTTYSNQLELIRSQWTAIRDEGLKLLNAAGNFKDEAENLRDTGDWKQFELFFRGQRIDKNCVKAPLTCRLVEQFTAARSCKRGQVKFSVMHPGTHVWPHCGPTNCRTRAHLGLKVPSGTSIRVADQVRSWENGKWLIFDDSFEHEVWHNGTTSRLVLIVDFWHPGLTEFQRKSLSPI